jgi:hypothetical protein
MKLMHTQTCEKYSNKSKNCDIKAPRQVATCQIPKCLSCSENKGNKRSHKQHCGSITQDDHHPVSNTSIDHVDAANIPGYTWQHKGRPTLKKYKDFMLFVDHKTRLVYPSFQESKTASEACRSICDYETFAKRYNITINSYHADNGAFRSEIFQKSIDNNNQKLNFSGVNAQWQNGLVECSNGTLCAAARSMHNHAISRWDKTIAAELWPFAIQHAATIYNTTKRQSRDYYLSPWEQFTGERSKLTQTDMHPLFCPIYVLDRRMQEGTSPHKWTKRTTQKVYVGHLHQYSKSVHNFMSCLMITSTLFKHPIPTSNNQTPLIVHSRQTDIYTMTLLAMNTHTYSLPGEQTYTPTT